MVLQRVSASFSNIHPFEGSSLYVLDLFLFYICFYFVLYISFFDHHLLNYSMPSLNTPDDEYTITFKIEFVL